MIINKNENNIIVLIENLAINIIMEELFYLSSYRLINIFIIDLLIVQINQ